MRLMHGWSSTLSVVDCAPHHYIPLQKETTKEERKPMFEPIRKIARALRAPSAAEREMAYLNGARDRFDLEYRQRQIDNGLFRARF